MITLEQARHLSELINDYTVATQKVVVLEVTLKEYEAARGAMTKYLASLVDPNSLKGA